MPTAAMISSIEVEAKPFASTAEFGDLENARARIDFRGLDVEHLYHEYGFSLEPFRQARSRRTNS